MTACSPGDDGLNGVDGEKGCSNVFAVVAGDKDVHSEEKTALNPTPRHINVV